MNGETSTRSGRRLQLVPTGSKGAARKTLQGLLPHSRTSPAGRRLAARVHARLLPGVCLVFYLGQGLAGTGALLYLAGPVHLSVGAVGGCMTAAGVLGLLAAVPAGRVCDRFGPKYMLVGALAAMAAAAFGFLAVRTVPEALGVACLYSAACQSAYTARGALAALVAPDDPARLNAALYRSGNVGYALATPIIGGAVARGTMTAYWFVLLGSAAAFALAAVACILVRARRPVAGGVAPARGRPGARPLRDSSRCRCGWSITPGRHA
jgi:MFS family permease